MANEPYNPLHKLHLGESVAKALLARPVVALPPPEAFTGAGVYALYYSGDFPAYKRIAAQNADDQWAAPIYVGKAVPAGARKGGYGLGEAPGESLLISMFSPLWNQLLDGFGNHDPGKGRYNQQNSPWDVIHPGRPWAAKLQPNSRSHKDILDDVAEFLG